MAFGLLTDTMDRSLDRLCRFSLFLYLYRNTNQQTHLKDATSAATAAAEIDGARVEFFL